MSNIEELEAKIKALKEAKAGIVSSSDVVSDVVSGEEVRDDLSNKVRNLIKELSKEGDYRFGVFVGNAGGKRKLIQCPHCNEKMVVAGVKANRTHKAGEPTQNQKDWMEYVRLVGLMPDNTTKGRKKHMKLASELKKKGVTLEELRKI